MGRLYIAEKPSAAKALAEQLGNPRRADGYYECDKGIVSYCIGHLLENASPDEYTSPDAPTTGKGTKIWRTEDLPIIPTKWILHPKKETKKQLDILGAAYGTDHAIIKRVRAAILGQRLDALRLSADSRALCEDLAAVVESFNGKDSIEDLMRARIDVYFESGNICAR